jgi:hypothetical protein
LQAKDHNIQIYKDKIEDLGNRINDKEEQLIKLEKKAKFTKITIFRAKN